MKVPFLICLMLLFSIHTPHAETQQTWSFEDLKTGTLPQDWDVAKTKSKNTQAKWEIVEDETSPMGKKVISLIDNPNRGETANILMIKNGVFQNVELSAKIKAGAIGTDTGGGIIWRAIDENHYYLAHWNAESNHLRLYVYIGGKPSLLESVSIEADPDTWHLIEVTHHEETIDILFDSESKMTIEDNQLMFKGWVGLWAQGSATPSFDDVNFYTEEEAE